MVTDSTSGIYKIKKGNKNRDKKMEIGQTARKKSQNLPKIYQNLQKFGHFLAKNIKFPYISIRSRKVDLKKFKYICYKCYINLNKMLESSVLIDYLNKLSLLEQENQETSIDNKIMF
ncbi:hypothetical protein BpHYR1_008594 [Brachionus plicatilis]|uniref:Uncharacterized protein n=1 Tax=Brachionus plicatilis TaxID=10195 RepID=A0A3M7PM36_BRAPC|nr:hypothetical protein BpHYR1_008594 [Brachionus plicatilis]